MHKQSTNTRVLSDLEARWSELMRAANRGDSDAYRRLLRELARSLHALVHRSLRGLDPEDADDVVQETLLALHLKRHTWDERRPLLPWLRAIAGNKLADNLRRRRHRVHVPIDEVAETLAQQPPAGTDGIDAERLLAILRGRKREIVASISIEGASARQVAERFGMSECAVRVAFHRALQTMARAVRGNAAPGASASAIRQSP